jgi:hypothetical protein
MRPNRSVVGSVVIAALALGALPGLAGSRAVDPIEPLPAGVFQQRTAPVPPSRSTVTVGTLDAAQRSAASLTSGSTIVERGTAGGPVRSVRTGVDQPDPPSATVRRPPRYTLSGEATYYDNGTTAMRLPRGTVVVICGRGSCIERVVTDYGPVKPSRVVDLYRPDFFAVCGCPWFAGVTQVTVYVY